MTIQELRRDPAFLALPPGEQLRGWREIDPEFAKLPLSEQTKGLAEMAGTVEPRAFPSAFTFGGAATGGMYGARAGAAFGPVGTFVGGLGGAALGGGAAYKAGELVDYFLGGPQPSGPVEGFAAGAKAGLEGQVLGHGIEAAAVPIKAAARAIAPGVGNALRNLWAASQFSRSPAGQTLQAAAAKHGMILSPAEQAGRPWEAKVEKYLEQTLPGAGPAIRLNQAQQEANRAAMGNLADQMAPATAPSPIGAEVQNAVDAALAQRARAAGTTVRGIAERVGPSLGEAETGQAVQKGLRGRETTIRGQMSAQLDALARQAGDVAEAPTPILQAVKAVRTELRPVRGITGQTPGAVAGRLKGGLGMPTTPEGLRVEIPGSGRSGHGQVDIPPGMTAAELRADPLAAIDRGSIVEQVIAQQGLDDPIPLTFTELQARRAAVNARISAATTDNDARLLKMLRGGIDETLDRLAPQVGPGFAAEYTAWKGQYREDVGIPFGRRSLGRRLETQPVPEKVSQAILGQDLSQVQLVKRQLLAEGGDPAAWRAVGRQAFDELLSATPGGAVNPTTGRFDPSRFMEQVAKYDPKTLQELWGVQATEVERLVVAWQRTGNPMAMDRLWGALVKAQPDAVIPALALQYGVDEVKATLATIPPDRKAAVARGMMEALIEKSTEYPMGWFSRQKWLTNLERHGDTLQAVMTPAQWRGLEEVRLVLRQQQQFRPWTDNPSGTGAALIAAGQVNAALGAAAATAGALVTLNIGKLAGAAATAGTLATPWVLARLLLEPEGARLFSAYAKATPGTPTWTSLLSQLAAVLTRLDPPKKGE